MAWSNFKGHEVMCKSSEQVKGDVGRYAQLKDLKLPKLSYICKFYRKLFLKLVNKVQETQLRQLKLVFFGRGRNE